MGTDTDTATAMDMATAMKSAENMRNGAFFGMRNCSLLKSAVVAACAWSGLASAGSWEVTDDIALTTTYVDRSGDNDGSGLVLELTPRVMAQGRGGRFTADINYAPNFAVGDSSLEPRFFTQNLRAVGRLEAVKNNFFIGAQASAGVRGTSATSGTVDAINFSDGGEQYFSARVMPEYRQHLNRYADIVSNNSIDLVTYSGGDSDNSNSYRLNLGIQSGRAFSALNWSVQANRIETDYDDRNDTEDSITANAAYSVDRQWRFKAGVGYEDNEVQTSRSDTSGTTWDVGADWTPTPRTSASVDYGDRYYGDRWAARASHRSRRTRVSLSYSEEVTNRRQQRFVDSFFFLQDSNGNIITDPFTGAPIVANIPQLEDIDEDFLESRLQGIVAVTGRRTDVTFTATVSERDYEVSDLDEDSVGVSMRVTRQLGSGYRASLFSSLTEANDTTDGDSENMDVRFSLSKQFSKRTSASVDMLYRDEQRDNRDDYTEKRIGLTLRANLL